MDNLKEVIVSKPNTPYFSNLKIKIPRFCPHCNQAISAITVEYYRLSYIGNEEALNVLLHKCPDCEKFFVTLHKRYKENNQELEYISVYPNQKKVQFHDLIEKISPRFIDVYNQAYTAEQQNHLDVAGAGYRLALEILIKDFAINALHEDPKVVKRKSLSNALKDYLDEQEALTSADVVRILGNDYVHYEQKHEGVEFTELKWYLEMFIKRLEAKLLFLNPPVPTRMIDA
ncbi:DUF4145 domain-containing protein [Metabacillus indicus]|uniref:DUF4145 domain-containing protein n=1 Tax=Metabacillus indicus TaxID=246786 RepID=UPI00049376BA|nr:DUF4145 domain-containing protein [Metabacillus indicus]KEZ51344.1 hypothetical protein AZ46_0212265 [Metabacillus indicus LMG 22858]